MSEPTSLDRFRKRKQRERAARSAAVNRAKHGLPKAERETVQREAERAERQQEGHRIVPADAPDTE